MSEIQPYKTSDTPLGAYLHMCGYKVVGTVQDPNDHKREVLLFADDGDIEALEATWRSGKAVGELREYQRSLKIVTRTVNEARKSR